MTKNGWKTLLFGAAHTCIAHIREYPPPPGWDLSKCKFVTLCKTLSYANFSPRGKTGNWAIGRLCVVPSNGIHFVFIQSPFLPTLIPISILLAVANLRHSFIVNYAIMRFLMPSSWLHRLPFSILKDLSAESWLKPISLLAFVAFHQQICHHSSTWTNISLLYNL